MSLETRMMILWIIVNSLDIMDNSCRFEWACNISYITDKLSITG